jgi:hypothetical protein
MTVYDGLQKERNCSWMPLWAVYPDQRDSLILKRGLPRFYFLCRGGKGEIGGLGSPWRALVSGLVSTHPHSRVLVYTPESWGHYIPDLGIRPRTQFTFLLLSLPR